MGAFLPKPVEGNPRIEGLFLEPGLERGAKRTGVGVLHQRSPSIADNDTEA